MNSIALADALKKRASVSRWPSALLIVLSLSTAGFVYAQTAPRPTWGTVDSGGGSSGSAALQLRGTIGQFDAGTLRGSSTTLRGGFWPGVNRSRQVPSQITISGRIADASGSPLSQVHVVLVGAQSFVTQSDLEGKFAFTGLAEGGTFHVVPYRPDLKFDPPQHDLETLKTDSFIQFKGETRTIAPVTIQQPTQAPAFELRLNRLLYAISEDISATLDLTGITLTDAQLSVILSAPASGDLELLQLSRTSASRYASVNTVRIGEFASPANVRVMDGELTLKPNEMFVAIWYVSGLSAETAPPEKMVWDFGLRQDPNFTQGPVQLLPELLMTDDEKAVPEGGKPIGTLLTEGGWPLQIPVNELVLFPQNETQLQRFLQESGGKIAATDVVGQENRPPTAYLVRVDAAKAPLAALPQMRTLLGESGKLYASSEAVLRLYALGLHFQLEGYTVAVNPRLHFMGVPSISAGETARVNPNMRNHPVMNIPRLWAFTALWDNDRTRIPLAFLDMGFAPNPDFRTTPGGWIECDMEGGRTILDFICGPGTAVGPPTVGASFFGDGMWHGNGVVTTAGGVVNNGWGSAGTGGQVVVPMLYRFGLASYAFEIGSGIRKAVLDGAAVINISAGYPCHVVTTLGIEPNICSSEGRLALCAAATATLAAAAATVCAAAPLIDFFAPGAGTTACVAATTAVTAASAACFATLIAGDLRGPMQSAVEFATEMGVPIVTVAGNTLSAEALPEIVRNIVNLSERRTERWQIIPAMIPQTIVAGASSDDWPFSNVHFFGERVDIWAPIESTFMAPTNTSRVSPPSEHALDTIGGTSAAAPYTAGVIAALQAANPSLNPRTPSLSPALRRAIPATLKRILAETAWTPAQLTEMAPADQRDATTAAGVERRNLINPFRALEAATPPEAMPLRAPSLGYAATLDFDETDAAAAADTRASARTLSTSEIAGTIVAMTGEGGAPTLTDVDWFHYSISTATPGIYRGRIGLRVPRGFGNIMAGPTGYEMAELSGTAEEAEFLITSPPMFAGASDEVMLHGILGSDNVYKISFLSALRISEAPPGDRFELSDPAVNPFESRPNNNVPERAVRLGQSSFTELNWRLTSSSAAGDLYEITIPDLNFHQTADLDWFEIRLFPDVAIDPDAPGCQPELEIEFAPEMVLTASTTSGMILLAREPSIVRIPWRALTTPLRLKLEPTTPGRAVSYTLGLRFRSANERICALGSIGAAIDEAMAARNVFRFPRYWPGLESFDRNQFPNLEPRVSDLQGRVTTPDRYLISWKGNGSFTATFDLLEGDSLQVSLRNLDGKTVAFARTSDGLDGLLLTASSRTALAAVAEPPLPSARPVLVLAATNLPPGDYVLEVSHGTRDTAVLVTLPAGATSDPSTSLEALLAGPPPQAPSLRAVLQQDNLVLSWPTSTREFILETTAGLSAPQWTLVGTKPSTVGGEQVVKLPPAATHQFFRLRASN